MHMLATTTVILGISLIALSIKAALLQRELNSEQEKLFRINAQTNIVIEEMRNLPRHLYDKEGNEYTRLDGEYGTIYSRTPAVSSR